MWRADLATLAAEGVPPALQNPVLIGIGAAFVSAKEMRDDMDPGARRSPCDNSALRERAV
jgi:hypothetical protein